MRIYHILIFIILSIIFYISCEIDKGLEAPPWIEGKIEIHAINRVEEGKTGDMVIVVAPDFPPKKWTDIIKSPPLDFRRDVSSDVIHYRIPLYWRKYAVVAALWKPKGKEWSFETISNILGVYVEPNKFYPKEVNLSRNKNFVPNVNLRANFDFVRYGSFITGNIIGKGEYNPQTELLILAAFPMEPETMIDYLFATGWDLGLPQESTTYKQPLSFALDVAPGYQKYIALFWKGKDSGPYDFKRIGAVKFHDERPPSQFIPGGIRLSKGDTLSEYLNDNNDPTKISLIADFDKTYEDD